MINFRNYYNFPLQDKDVELSRKLKKDTDFQQSELNKITKFLTLLSYDPSQELIYRTVSNKGDAVWYHTKNDKQIEIPLFKEKEKVGEISEIVDLKKILLTHFYPYELKNHKPKKLNTNRPYTDTEKINMNLMNKGIWGSYLKNESDILVMDIDSHDNANTLEMHQVYLKVLSYLKENNITPIFKEVSQENSYHIYIKLNKKYSIEDKKNFLENLNNELELINIHTTSILRFPCSLGYNCLNQFDEYISNNEAIELCHNLYKTIEGLKIKEVEKTLYIEETTKKVIEPVVKIKSVYKRNKKFSKNITTITPEEYIQNNLNTISKDNRHFKFLEVIRVGKFNSWTLPEIKNVILSINDKDSSSKDLEKWNNNQLIEQIEQAYNMSTIIPIRDYCSVSDNYNPDKFISNIELIPKEILKLITNKSIIQQIIINCGYKKTEINRTKFKIILQEMIGFIYYNAINQKELDNFKNKDLLKGVQYSKEYADKLKEYYIDKLDTTDVHGIIKSILNNSNIFNQYFSNTKGWVFYNSSNPLSKYNRCKQFDLSTNKNNILLINKDVINVFILTSIKRILVTSDLINIKLLYYTIYLLSMIDVNSRYNLDDYVFSDTG